MTDSLKEACNRIADLLERDDGQAYKEGRRFLSQHAPELLDRDGEIEIKLLNGVTLCTGPDGNFAAGAYISVMSPDGNEVGYWDAGEWQDDPVMVMGAILLCAKQAAKDTKTQTLRHVNMHGMTTYDVSWIRAVATAASAGDSEILVNIDYAKTQKGITPNIKDVLESAEQNGCAYVLFHSY